MKYIAKKKFGQNFLKDTSIIHAIIQSINPLPDDLLIEIGPGLGALTKP
ncbi:MAG: 16S rRNA (adenine(1518)-N(6)/adenine(1519)-N(6))-dimethyltransferase, partial [Proteobacteria bacterium]|nr:16S rRNA (adenine(1518)-N(6)/adenine(1519)-N(6))-dimethyltransferase [Candidatus Fonsibacter sp. PEL5]